MSAGLEFDSVELAFNGRPILSNIYMACEPGDIVGLLGRNGAGKSCLLQIVFGSRNATHKSVRINGQHLTGNYIGKKLVAYLPQDSFLQPYLTVYEHLKWFGMASYDRLGFPDTLLPALHQKPYELSGGMKRMLELILILNSPAPFCLLDEPFTGLAPVQVENAKALIRTATTHGKGVVITDHLHHHIRDISTKLYLLGEGSLYPVKDETELQRRGYLPMNA